MTNEESGQTSVLIVGFAVVLLLMVGLVVDASAAYLRRQGLSSLADGAALAATDGAQGTEVYGDGLGERALIDPVAARRHVEDYLDAADAAGQYPGLSYDIVSTPDSVVVTVRAPLDLPVTPPGWEERPVISATSAAFVFVSD